MEFYKRRSVGGGHFLGVVCFLVACVISALKPIVNARTWTDVHGRQIEAEYESLKDGKVHLSSKGGQVYVPLENLSQEDQDWIHRQNDPNQDFSGDPVEASQNFELRVDGYVKGISVELKNTVDEIVGRKLAEMKLGSPLKLSRSHEASNPPSLYVLNVKYLLETNLRPIYKSAGVRDAAGVYEVGFDHVLKIQFNLFRWDGHRYQPAFSWIHHQKKALGSFSLQAEGNLQIAQPKIQKEFVDLLEKHLSLLAENSIGELLRIEVKGTPAISGNNVVYALNVVNKSPFKVHISQLQVPYLSNKSEGVLFGTANTAVTQDMDLDVGAKQVVPITLRVNTETIQSPGAVEFLPPNCTHFQFLPFQE